ncbi:MAG: PEP-utilizing enzyme [Patescibacteria group bacterium]|nr:PEP-utilizing enzyme [Patescibacteria group bacterium]
MPKQKIILKGIPASSGVVRGKIKIVNSLFEIDKMEEGDILVSILTNPHYLPAILKAKAIVTDIGGILSHHAIVAREMGIPCVVGTNEATKKLKDNMEVIVDGEKGEVIVI